MKYVLSMFLIMGLSSFGVADEGFEYPFHFVHSEFIDYLPDEDGNDRTFKDVQDAAFVYFKADTEKGL